MFDYEAGVFSTDKAEERGYWCLEDRMHKTDIDNDKCTRKTVGLRDWHRNLIDIVKDGAGTNQVTVFYGAYISGTTEIRDAIGKDEILEMRELRQYIRGLAGFRHTSKGQADKFEKIASLSISDPNTNQGKINHTPKIKAKNSVVSEVEDFLEVDVEFGPWIHRDVISLGLGNSQFLFGEYEDLVEESKQSVVDSYEKSRRNFEEVLRSTIADEYEFWLSNGITDSQLQCITDGVSIMRTKHSSVAEVLVGDIKEEAEIIEDQEK